MPADETQAGTRPTNREGSLPDLVPARMLNEYAYCPRLAYLEWVQADWAESADTVEGTHAHRRVDRERGAVPDAAEAEDARIHARSVHLSAPTECLTARIDLLEGEGLEVRPVDYKRGAKPDIPGGAYEPERVQLCAQALILEENGYRCAEGVLYYVGSKERVIVPIDDALRARTRALVSELRRTAAAGVIPPPLVDSPKCPRCSLVGICLPDEVHLLAEGASARLEEPVRRLFPVRDDALPLYVQKQGATVTKKDECLVVTEKGQPVREVRLVDTSQVSVFGGVQVTTAAVRAMAERGAPICYFSQGGWFYAITHGMTHKNAELRRAQFAAAADPARSLGLARRFVSVKIRNARTLVRRNHPAAPADSLRRLRRLAAAAWRAPSLDVLLGIEGGAGREYFERFGELLRGGLDFAFEGRNRRPPTDPVNALLSLGYAMLTKDVTLVLMAVGFDPYVGFYHQPRYGKPALALDLMEEFRPLIVDSVVLGVVNGGVVKAGDFIRRAGAVALGEAARARFIQAYERRMDELVTHPVFRYRVSYRRILEVQARLLGRHLAGEIKHYPAFVTR
jgi:CRISPR-associated protein Cas1